MKTVKDLIKELSQFDPDLPVMRPGYEGGVTNIKTAELVKVTFNCNTEWYLGPHELDREGLNKAIILD